MPDDFSFKGCPKCAPMVEVAKKLLQQQRILIQGLEERNEILRTKLRDAQREIARMEVGGWRKR